MTRYTPQWLQSGSYAASVDRRLIGALWPAGATVGCAVSPASAMIVNIAAGQVAVPTQNNTGVSLCSSDAVEQVTLTAAPASGQNRYDLVVCQPRGTDLDGGGNNDFIFAVVTGVAAASPSPPAAPNGTLALAQIYVPGASASVTAGNITDLRPGGLAVATSIAPRYGARRWRQAALTSSATAGTPTVVPYDVEIYDQANAYNPATGVYTCPAAGRYVVRATAGASIASGQAINVKIQLNGTDDASIFTGNPLSTSAVTHAQVVDIVLCAAGDTLQALWWTTAASVAWRAVRNEGFIAVDYLGPS